MKQFYVDTQGILELWNLLQEKAKEAKYRLELDFGSETAQTHPIILFNTLRNCYLRLTVVPKEYQEFEIMEALTYFRELKEEREKSKLKTGDQMICVKDLVMNISGKVESKKGKLYPITVGGLRNYAFIDESGFSHEMPYPNEWHRLATPEEISAAQKIFIGGYEVKFGNIGITIHHKTYDKLFVFNLYQSMQDFNVKALIFHDCNGKGIEVDYETVKKVTERLK
jgi:hypothetical protein